MKSAEIESMYMAVYKQVYSLPSILRRTLFPPHVVMLFANLVHLRSNSLNDRLHPMLGIHWPIKKSITKIIPVISRLITHPFTRKISKLVRYMEGRIVR